MPLVIVEYQTKPDRSDENERLVGEVFAELRNRAPADVRYAVVRLGDRFVHIVDTSDTSSPLGELATFEAFQAGIPERVAVPPNASPATLIGAYPPTFPFDTAPPPLDSRP